MTEPLAFTLIKPFDTHLHGREGNILQAVMPCTSRQFWGAILEPNLETPITTIAHARAYRQEVADASKSSSFKPYVLAYFTDTIDPDELARGCADGDFIGMKFYPRGATTNSERGVVDVSTLWTPGTRQYLAIKAVHSSGKVVQLHGEINYDLQGLEIDPYDKEPYFFSKIMPRLMEAHDGKFSAEHLTSKEGVAFLRKHGDPNRLGCSITAHHLLYDRRDMLRGGLRPHLYCLPVLKRIEDRKELWTLVRTGTPFVYAGTDSAPHDRRKKESDCCSAGVFSAHAAVEFYANHFQNSTSTIAKTFEPFMSLNGPRFYGLQPSAEQVTLKRGTWPISDTLQYSPDPLDVIWKLGYDPNPKARKQLDWKLV